MSEHPIDTQHFLRNHCEMAVIYRYLDIRAVGPSRIEICLSTSTEQIDDGHFDHLQTLDLV